MASPDPLDDPYQHAMQNLTSFLHETSKNIQRILHTYCSTIPSRNDRAAGSMETLTVTRSLLPNIEENSPSSNEAILIAFMEGIVRTSNRWSAQHKAILEGKNYADVAEANPNEAFKMCDKKDENTTATDEEKVGTGVCEPNLKEASKSGGEKEEKKSDIVATHDSKPKQAFRFVLRKQQTSRNSTGDKEVEGEEETPSDEKEDATRHDLIHDPECEKRTHKGGLGSIDSNVDAFWTPKKKKIDGGDGGGGGGGDEDGDEDRDGDSDGEKSELPLTKWVPPPSSSSDMKLQQYRRPIEVISSPDWLPEGWVTELKTRGSGNSAGTKDKYYVDPVSKRRFRSRKEVVDFLETGKMNRHRKRPDTSPIRKLREPEIESPPIPTVGKQPIKRAKSNPTTMPTNMASLQSLHSTSSGMMNNMYMPFRSGQPSEWLMYESLASLPFPMFDPYRYAEMNANKSTASKGPPPVSNRPWFFTGPEASWMPFSGHPRPAEKTREYNQSPHYSMPPSYVPESSSKKHVRKSSKRTPP